MLDQLTRFLDAAGEHGPAVLAFVFVVSAVEAAFGIGALVPAETALVLAAVILTGSPLLIAAVFAAAAGAFIGDHAGFALGRRFGDRIAHTRAVRRIGVDRWHDAGRFIAHRGIGVIIVARLLPGVRTLIAAAAGASPMRYRRFATATGIAALAWALLWVLGGAALGSAFLAFADRATVPALIGAAALIAAVVVVRRRRRGRTAAR
ncbi:VTT domain-containing protein [Glycomyces sp. TRM65418]|uniref:DedA family protein n=1 Tax=Glycomyces sp. TRM65418 TaxID=2867006 RepID=UPI001CE63A13|nr:VTT domain-containing protein [Glycomyces sp. TRM65418]MCC3763187.1 VTT domain-containing protein [Glycomyces sp. TRM65418]QZD57192.1 VTT domain-containing protein [Glycomyces sp. TRM65418]